MKKFIWTLGVAFLFAALTSCGPTSNDAVEYNDKIIAQQSRIVKSEEKFMNALEGSPEEMKSAFDSLVSQVNLVIAETGKLGDFDGKRDFLDATLKMLNLYKGVVESDYKTLIDVLSKPQEEITEEDQERYNKAIQEAHDKLETANKELEDAQKKFATDYNFIIDPTKVVE